MLRDPLTRAYSQFRHEANEHKTNASVSIFEGMLRRQIREFEACEKGLPPNSTMVYAWLRCFGAIGRQDGNWLSLIARSMYDPQVGTNMSREVLYKDWNTISGGTHPLHLL